MEIILAKTAGFCFGVERAVNLAFNAKADKNTYTLGPIIHNDEVIHQLKQDKGIMPIENLDDKEIDTLIIRSHGVSADIYEKAKEKGIQIIDATCPYVKKIHQLVAKYDANGYQIILIGDKNHPEVIGINGWAKTSCLIVKDKEEAKNLQLNPEQKYLVVAQTTYKKAITEDITSYLKNQAYCFEYIHTICNATKERQDEALSLSKKVDCMLVIGSQYSSNTQKLFEICSQSCANTYCIASVEDLNPEWIRACMRVGITAGASTPASSIHKVIESLKQMSS